MKGSKQFLLILATAAVVSLAACGGGGDVRTKGDSQPTPLPTQPPATDDMDADGVTDGSDNCPSDSNAEQLDSDVDGAGDACDPLPEIYAFTNSRGDDSVSYTGQTKRHILIADLTAAIDALVEGGVTTGGVPDTNVVGALNFYFRFSGDTSDSLNTLFTLGNENLLPGDGTALTYGAISSGKDLAGKIAGGNGAGGGESSRLIDDEFFGWEAGFGGANFLPIDLVDYLFEQLQASAIDNLTPNILLEGTSVPLDTVTVSATGIDYRQLIQKLLLGAVTFSQGVNDYFQTDFANELVVEEDKAYTIAEHDWDEAFGYFGAARNYAAYTDAEIAAKGGRAEFSGGYNDANGDGAIDIRGEYNFGNSTNCGKRDLGTAANTSPTDFTQRVMSAFIVGREILKNAAASGVLSTDAETILHEQITIASKTWEACIAATVIHYINELLTDMDSYDTNEGVYSSLENFKNVAKHWSEMKGFALGLQFSPASPFRESDAALNDLKTSLQLMGDAPVLADGTQGGEAYIGGVAGYREDLLTVRALLQAAYRFDIENVESW